MGVASLGDIAHISDLQILFGKTVSSLVALAGIVLFVMIFMGGLKYITSGGDPKALEGAKKTITFAVFGLLAILFSYLILVLIQNIAGLGNSDILTKFKITI